MSQVTWDQVAEGDLVLGARDGQEWQVVSIDAERVKLSRAGREASVPLPPGTVTRIATAAQVSERALAVVQVVLGGEVVAKREHNDPRGHRCPAVYLQPAALASHLMLFHGAPDAARSVGPWGSGIHAVEDGGLTMGQLVALHQRFHDDEDAGNPYKGTIKHWHDPRFDSGA